MTIDITALNKKIFKRILTEENERDNITRNMFKRVIESGKTDGKQEEYEDVYNTLVNKKKYFENVISLIEKTTEINVSDDELEYFKYLLKNQKVISESRLGNLEKPDGWLYRCFRSEYLAQGKSEQEIEVFIKNIADYDIKNLECCEQLSNLLFPKN